MDPLSIAFGVITLLELTKKIIIYAKQTKDAPADRTRVLQEASSLTGLLSTLKDFIEDCDDSEDPWLHATSSLTAQDGPLHQCRLTLESIVAKLTSIRGHGKIGQALAWVFSKEEVARLLAQIERVKSFVQIALQIDHTALTRAILTDMHKIHDGLADLKISNNSIVNAAAVIKNHTTSLQDDAAVERKRELLEWICPADYSVQHGDYIDRRQPDTGEWFLQDPRYHEWVQSEQSTLFCPGLPGAGKTMMAALVIDRLLRSEHEAERPVVFIYCSYKRRSEQSIKHMLCTLLRQVVDIQEGIPEVVQDFYTAHVRKRTTPSTQEVEQILRGVAKGLLGLTVLVDALDECEAQTCQNLLSTIEALRKQCKVRLLATSRFLPDIQSHTSILDKPSLEVRASEQDLELYIRSRVGEFCSPVASNPDLLEIIVSSIVNATGGMFLLAQLFMNSLVPKLNVKKVKTALKTLPQGSDAYDIAYSAAMERISAQGKEASEMAKKILSWILCARRPLSTLELLHALAVEVDETAIDEDSILDTEQIFTICAGLVTIDEQSDTVRFIHFTTQEYLQRNRETWLPDAEVEIARICTAYLSLDDLSAGPCSSKQDFDHRDETLPLMDYAAVHWGSHMNVLVKADFESELGGEVQIEVLSFLSNVKCLSSASQALFMSGEEFFSEDGISQEGKGFAGSHWIGRFGLALLFRQWDSVEATHWDDADFSGRTPLSWAAGEGHEVVSKLLLETGRVDIDSRDTLGRTPFSWACGDGRETTVKLLLDGKADVNSRDDDGQTPLIWATQNGQEAVVKLLLSISVVEVDSPDDSGWTPLLWAVRRKDEAMVKLLLSTSKVDVESRNWNGQTPLSWAVQKGSGAIVKLLLDSGTGTVDVGYQREDGRTLLALASEYGQEAAVKLLLDTGRVDVNSKDDIGQTPLILATKCQHEAVVRLLLDTGEVDVDCKDRFGGTALLWAARNGQEMAVKLLLDTGKVDVNWKDTSGWTPIRYATEKGYRAIAELLLSTGKDQIALPSHG